jgi:hypothetical protein
VHHEQHTGVEAYLPSPMLGVNRLASLLANALLDRPRGSMELWLALRLILVV